jgi:DNA polymerase-3 subunit epsilon
MKNILFIDTETTGLNPDKHGIISLCAKVFSGKKKETTNFWYHFNSEFDKHAIDLSAMRFNGVNLSDGGLKYQIHYGGIAGRGFPKPNDHMMLNEECFIKSFCDFLIEVSHLPNLFLGGNNVAFHLSFINKCMERHNINSHLVWPLPRVLDTQVIASFLQSAGIIDVPNLKVEALCQHFNIENDGSKNALNDVDAAAALYFAMAEKVSGN